MIFHHLGLSHLPLSKEYASCAFTGKLIKMNKMLTSLGHTVYFYGARTTNPEFDIEKYIDYNLNDVKLVVELDKKLDFIDLAYNICHKGHVGYDDIFMPSKYIEGAALTFIKRQNLVSINKKHRKAITLQKSHSIISCSHALLVRLAAK